MRGEFFAHIGSYDFSNSQASPALLFGRRGRAGIPIHAPANRGERSAGRRTSASSRICARGVFGEEDAAPSGAPLRHLPGATRMAQPRVRASWDVARGDPHAACPSPAGSLQCGRSAALSGPGPLGSMAANHARENRSLPALL